MSNTIRVHVVNQHAADALPEAVFYALGAALVERGFVVPNPKYRPEGWAEVFLKRKGGESWFSQFFGERANGHDYEVVVGIDNELDTVQPRNGSFSAWITGLKAGEHQELMAVGKSKLLCSVRTGEGLHLEDIDTPWGRPYVLGTAWPGFIQTVGSVADQIKRIVGEHQSGRTTAVKVAARAA